MSNSKKIVPAALAFAAASLVPFAAMAADGSGGSMDVHAAAAFAAALAIGLGALGGTLAQGRAAAAALEGIARNPGAADRIQTPMILGLALIESLVLLAFVIAIMLKSVAG